MYSWSNIDEILWFIITLTSPISESHLCLAEQAPTIVASEEHRYKVRMYMKLHCCCFNRSVYLYSFVLCVLNVRRSDQVDLKSIIIIPLSLLILALMVTLFVWFMLKRHSKSTLIFDESNSYIFYLCNCLLFINIYTLNLTTVHLCDWAVTVSKRSFHCFTFRADQRRIVNYSSGKICWFISQQKDGNVLLWPLAQLAAIPREIKYRRISSLVGVLFFLADHIIIM